MIDRYSRQEMTQIWSQQSRFSYMLEVEKAAAKAQAELKMIPVNAAKQIEKLGKFSVSEIQEIARRSGVTLSDAQILGLESRVQEALEIIQNWSDEFGSANVVIQ